VKLLAIVVVLVSLLAAGCGGDESSPEVTTQPAPVPKTTPEPEAGKVLDSFVQAAAAGDTSAMWDLLSTRTQARYGPTPEAFGKRTGKELARALGLFAKTGKYDVTLSERATPLWAVAAISGYAVHEGDKQYGAYAVPLRKENGKWKIELGGTVNFSPLTPDTELPSESTPDISAEVTASEPILDSRLWVV
jgi:hypothetical protein